MLKDLIARNRSYRRFHQEVTINAETLHELVDLARLSASASNKQPLRYLLSWEAEQNATIFQYLAWAGYIEDWDGPEEGERPAAYIIILRDSEIGDPGGCDHGIAAQSIMLGATERGLGGCIVGSIQRKPLRNTLNIPEKYEILLVLALGKPAEQVEIETVGEDGDIKYWHDEAGVHHVPKHALDKIILD